MIVRERETKEGLLVSVCDAAILGETFKDGDVSLTVDPEFYDGEEANEADEESVVESLTRATIANIVGTESVQLAIEHGIVDEAHVLEIDSTLHAQLLRM